MIFNVSPNDVDGIASIADALKMMSEGDELHIESGTYYECITFDKSKIRVVGDAPETTVISFDNFANMVMEDGSRRGTFRSYTAMVDASFITLENLTFANTSGDGRKVGQALAMYAQGHKIHFKNCRFLGHQDTLFTGPLPKKSAYKGGFAGPKEFAPRINGLQWYENCYIEGDVDFIFGCATAFFTDCTMCSLARNMEPNGYISAPATYKEQKYGYVFAHCKFTNRGCSNHSVYISRPWREWASQVMIDCEFGEHIKEEGYHDWGKPEAHEHSYYVEYPVSKARVDWVKPLDDRGKSEYDELLFRICNDWDNDDFEDVKDARRSHVNSD